jgi:protein TonB
MTTSRQKAAARGAYVPETTAPANGRAASTRAASPQVAFVTADADLAAAVRHAVPSLSIMIAATPTALADLLLSSSCVVLIVDVAALGSTAVSVLNHLAKQFPDIPVVAVGTRQEESVVSGLISSGQIYRFLHRPISPERTRNFLDAALRRHAAVRPPAAPRAPEPVAENSRVADSRPLDPRLILYSGIGVAILVVAGVVYHRMHTPPEQSVPAAATPVMTLRTAVPAAAPPAQDPTAIASAPAVATQPAADGRVSAANAERPRPRPDRVVSPPAAAIQKPLAAASAPPTTAESPAAPAPTTTAQSPAAPAPTTRAETPAVPVPTPAAELGAARTTDTAATLPLESPPSAPLAEAKAAAAVPTAPPRKLVNVAPEYPVGARTSGTEGWVNVKFTVNAYGVPEDVRSSGAKPAGVFEAAALAAVRRWRYEPPAAPQDVEQRLRFRLR